jgi:cyclic pyranopterin monophosphate synthase
VGAWFTHARARGFFDIISLKELPAVTGSELTHIDAEGRLRMVDVSAKDVSLREARAEATVCLSAETMQRIAHQDVPKGNVYEAARLAGIMAAKKTWELIPLCHPVRVNSIAIEFIPDAAHNLIKIASMVRAIDRTGVEMEALVAVTHAALTIYDMCKAIDRGMTIQNVQLTFKSGGRSGTYHRG